MKKFCLLIVCLLVAGQGVGHARKDDEKTRLFDIYGAINSESAMARLDNFAIELTKRPGATGYMVCYGPEGEGSGTGKYMLQVQKDYLVSTRGLGQERVKTIYGGRYFKPDDVETELWIAPVGADAPELKGYETRLDTIKGKFTEYKSWDGYPEDGGPPMGNVFLASLADILRQQPKSVAFIVAFNLRGTAPGTWRRVAKRDASDLQAYGIGSDRIKIIYGGEKPALEEDVQQALVQLWVLPADAPPPIEEAKPEATPKEAARLGTYNDYILKEIEEERRVFEGFVDVLSADARLNVCLIIRPRSETTGQSLTPGDPPDPDPLKLAEKWKSEATEKYRINGNRIIVMAVDARGINEGTVEVWVVPNGAALPNPYSSDYESLDEDSQEP